MGDPAQLRVSDAEREAVVARLGQAAAEGRLTLHEFDARAGQAYASRTRVELSLLVDDLPPTGAVPTGPSGEFPPVLALVLGAISLPLGFCPPAGIMSAAVAIVVALVALGVSGRRAGGRPGLAVAGLVCGVVGLAYPLALAVLFGF